MLEAESRLYIDKQLIAYCLLMQDKSRLNIFEFILIAIRKIDTDITPVFSFN